MSRGPCLLEALAVQCGDSGDPFKSWSMLARGELCPARATAVLLRFGDTKVLYGFLPWLPRSEAAF